MKNCNINIPHVGDPYESLCAAILARATQDAVSGEKQHRQDSYSFLRGKWFERLCEEALDLDPDYMRSLIRRARYGYLREKVEERRANKNGDSQTVSA